MPDGPDITTDQGAREACAALRKQGLTRDGIGEELVRRGLTPHEAALVLEGFPLPPRPVAWPAGVAGGAAPDDLRPGIRGWLVVWAIHLVVGGLWFAANARQDLAVLGRPDLPALEALQPGVRHAITLELAANAGLLLVTVVATILLFARKRQAPQVMILSLALEAVVIPAMAWYARSILGDGVSPRGVGGPVIAAAAWIPYWLRSQRVRLTFTR